MLLLCGKYKWILLLAIWWPYWSLAQVTYLTQPWSYSVNYTFGRGTAITGPPITGATTDLTYTPNACPAPGEYAISSKVDCPGMNVPKMKVGGYEIGGTFYYGYTVTNNQPPGYMLFANYHPSSSPRTLFSTTVRGLCSNRDYLFWSAIRNLTNSSCFYPNLTFSVETLTGTVIQAFQTGDIGGPNNGFNDLNWYIGFFDHSHGPPVSFYGGTFTLPAGINDVVLKIIINPVTGVYPDCTAGIALDNILLTPMGPGTRISIPGDVSGYKTSACFLGNVPLQLTSTIGPGYQKFGTTDSIPSVFVDPAVQWQQSLDEGFTWQDIPGETNPTLDHVFRQPDTFYVRLRAAGAADIGNLYCNVVSNIIKVEVDSLPGKYSIATNSPVCTDSDVVFHLEGGAFYTVTGPNGYSDNSNTPHIFHPTPADSGWYYVDIISLGGCPVKDSTHVVIHGPSVQVGPDAAICYGKSVRLEASGGNKYAWSPTTGLSDAASATPLASPLGTTKYQVKVTDETGCSAFASVKVTLRDTLLVAGFSAPEVACPRDLVTFADISRGAIVRWAWDFGNGEGSVGQEAAPQVYPYTNGFVDYTVRLFVTDTANCTDTALRVVKSVNNCHIAVPSAFTPNGDGTNDYLYPLNAWKATDLLFRVYSRNGQLVYETRDWTKKWDGRVNGSVQPGGVFVWTLDYVDEQKKRVVLKGTTVLVR